MINSNKARTEIQSLVYPMLMPLKLLK